MTLHLRDTLTGETRPLQPLEPDHVRIYSCGPTVYGPTHIGNFRSFLFADVLVRYLRYRGLRVTWVMNITDVDDRIIASANAAGQSIGELTTEWIEQFADDLGALRVTQPDVLPRATDHIDDMARIIATLLERGHAYRTEDGSIFFRISSWPAYGRLARLDPAQLQVGERVEADDYGKDDVRDFALWKGPKPGEPSWDTPIGPGRPGWHIECSAMSMRHLGESFDIHTGGIDLIFPHHEDEIAQSEAATGKTFVQTWLHCDHLRLGGSKMARRVGNIARVVDLLAEGVSPRALRYALISVHYRQALEYTPESLTAAAAAIERLDALELALDAYSEERADSPDLPGVLDEREVEVRSRDGRRPQCLGCPRGALRPGPRAQPTHRGPLAVERRRGAGARRCPGPRPRARDPARRSGRSARRGGSAARGARGGSREPRLGGVRSAPRRAHGPRRGRRGHA